MTSHDIDIPEVGLAEVGWRLLSLLESEIRKACNVLCGFQSTSESSSTTYHMSEGESVQGPVRVRCQCNDECFGDILSKGHPDLTIEY